MNEQSSASSLKYITLPRGTRGVFGVKTKLSGLTVWLWVVCSAIKLAPKPQHLEKAPAENPLHPDLGSTNPRPEPPLRATPSNTPQVTSAGGASKSQFSAKANKLRLQTSSGQSYRGRGMGYASLSFFFLFFFHVRGEMCFSICPNCDTVPRTQTAKGAAKHIRWMDTEQNIP